MVFGMAIVLAYSWWTLFLCHLTSFSSDISSPRNCDYSTAITRPPFPTRSSLIFSCFFRFWYTRSFLPKLYPYAWVYCLPLTPPSTTISSRRKCTISTKPFFLSGLGVPSMELLQRLHFIEVLVRFLHPISLLWSFFPFDQMQDFLVLHVEQTTHDFFDLISCLAFLSFHIIPQLMFIHNHCI